MAQHQRQLMHGFIVAEEEVLTQRGPATSHNVASDHWACRTSATDMISTSPEDLDRVMAQM